jgi:hypothetical protein
VSQDATFIKGGNLKKVCEVKLADGSTVTVEPYAIFTSPRKLRHYLWFRTGGSNPDEGPGWQSPEASLVASVRLGEQSFTVRRDYDPFDKGKFPVVHHSIATHDGRQRWLDAGPPIDKSTIRNRSL